MSALVRLGVKLGLVGVPIYVTKEAGLWADSKTSVELYKTLRNKVEPYVREYAPDVPPELRDIPRASEISAAAAHYWNAGVMMFFKFLIDLPDHSLKYSAKGVEFMKNLVQDPEPLPK